MVCGASVFYPMTLAMCSGVETTANFNHRSFHRAHGAAVVAYFDL